MANIRKKLCKTLTPAELEYGLLCAYESGLLTEIYGEVEATIAIKGEDSLYAGQKFIHHNGKKTKAKMLGLPQGSYITMSVKKNKQTKRSHITRLWKQIPQ